MSIILIVGSAHLDLLARATERDDVVDKIGTLNIGVGGTACNVAVNIANVGTSARLLTALNGEEISKVVEDYLTRFGVETLVHYDSSLPSSGFSAHVDRTGEITSAVSSMAVEHCNFPDELVDAALDGVAAVVLDCNLSVKTLNQIATKATASNIPIYVCAVSEPKSVRWAGISSRVKCAFMNAREAAFLSKQVFGRKSTPANLAALLGTTLLITDAENGSDLATPTGQVSHIPAPDFDRATLINGTRLGMGDAMAAGTIVMHQMHGFDLVHAASNSLKMVRWIGESKACNKGQHNALELAMADFKKLATYDALTGTLNRASIEHAISRAINERRAGGHPFSILVLDIDHFKGINDAYGHNTGDEVLKAVAAKVGEGLRAHDSLGRWGGEEFVVMLDSTNINGAIMVGNRIREAVMQLKHPRQITLSVGCAEFSPSHHKDVKSLIASADGALYRAKDSGRNRVMAMTPLGEVA
jgi:diguanylate cyclase (GGDEF)-like protein